MNAPTTIAGPNGKYVLFSGFSLNPLKIRIQDVIPSIARMTAPIVYSNVVSAVIILKCCNE